MTNETDIKVPVTECEARTAYIAMPGKRSAARLHETFIKEAPRRSKWNCHGLGASNFERL